MKHKENNVNQLSPEEQVQAFVFPHNLTDEEKSALDEEMRAIRLEKLKSQTDEQKMYADLVQLRIKMEDYIDVIKSYDDNAFGQFLIKYLKIINRTQRTFAKEIDLHFTKLNRILNGKEDPNMQLAYRLETHSGNMLSAKLWWKIYLKKLEYQIDTTAKLKQAEADKVSNALHFTSDLQQSGDR